MNAKGARLLLAAATAGTVLLSCNGGDLGDESGGGIGGSGIVAQGTITDFGSIFVNGVEYETSMAEVEIDERRASEGDLRLGMYVTVRGRRNDDTTGVADGVVVDHNLRGPVGTVEAPSANGKTRTVDIFGTTVTLRRKDTVFEGEGFGFDTIAMGDQVRVSALPGSRTGLRATRVEKIGDALEGTEVKLTGEVEGWDGIGLFLLGRTEVRVDAATEISGGPLVDGRFVEVEGLLRADLVSVLATEIEPDDDEALPEELDDFEIEGVVTAIEGPREFVISGVRVDATDAKFKPRTLAETLALGDRVEVEGAIRNGVLHAEEVIARDDDDDEEDGGGDGGGDAGDDGDDDEEDD